ncbi:hypothetical protein OPV22_024125 [Ensete ventricosum]|uniref:DYW domain-containing protein n=1 Tax=Ensete ventricosum TaxID=4639 RepID=A0AAV8QTN5_ENSVE|nr:hypothetical protein OPV22_024125 [Ensete ventricosum]RWW81248.1 hypothetical protein BHE74_00010381 [Ensete ventricosum]
MLPWTIASPATPTGFSSSPRGRSLLRLLRRPIATLPLPSPRPFSLTGNASFPTPVLRSSPHPSPPEDATTDFVRLLKASSRSVKSLLDAGLLHSVAVKAGLGQDDRVRTGLLRIYCGCGRVDLAGKLFDEIRERDVLAWTLLISGRARAGQYREGLEMFAAMLAEGPLPNRFTLSCVLKCCVGCGGDLGAGKSVHGWVLRNGTEFDVVLLNSVLDFYAKCGAFACTKNLFRTMNEKDAISWNIMIGAYLRQGDIDGSMELFRTSPYQDVSSWNTIISGQMEHGLHAIALQILHTMVDMGPRFNQFTFSTALVIASRLTMLDLGKQLHCQILRTGHAGDVFVRSSLIDMYSKCGDVHASSSVFSGSSEHTDGTVTESISFSAMVAGYVQNGMSEEALELLRDMFQEGVKVDQFTLTSAAAACSDAGILEQGMQVHCCVVKLGHVFDAFLSSAITDMYAKCGSLEDARKAFDDSRVTNVVLWTSIIGSYASHGRAAEAIHLFEQMSEEKIVPNEISFVHVLSACAHAGLVGKGHAYFKSMQEDHGIAPSVEHYTCMVDLLGRAGLLDRAKDFIQEEGISNYPVVWRALLSACRVHSDVEMASWVCEQLVQLEPCESGHYILLSNIHASRRKWEEASELRRMMHEKGVRKRPGQSWIQIRNKVHTFMVGDKSHPEAAEIYSYLESLIGRLKEMGYASRTDLVLHDVEEEQRESILNFHSEKLAVAYGIMSTPKGIPIRVMKNLRVCADCHEAIKYISQATCREIILRDAYRFHRFSNGKCSCGDYW